MGALFTPFAPTRQPTCPDEAYTSLLRSEASPSTVPCSTRLRQSDVESTGWRNV